MTELSKSVDIIDAIKLEKDYRQLKESAVKNPLLNPVRRLASDLFLALENHTLTLENLAAVIRDINYEAFEDRARAFHARRTKGSVSELDVLLEKRTSNFEQIRDIAEHTRTGVVFTAHPTFALGAEKRDLIACFPRFGDKNELSEWRRQISKLSDVRSDEITLHYEHKEASKAIANAQEALQNLNLRILSFAQRHFSDQWRTLRPNPVSIASWVGYDLDGRTDIHWGETVRIRLEEKAVQLRRYETALDKILEVEPDTALSGLRDTLKQAASLAEKQTAAFSDDLSNSEVVINAANMLTKPSAGKLTSLKAAIVLVTQRIEDASNVEKITQLILLRSEMEAFGLGIARIHLRVNAAQVRSALRADLGLDPDVGFMGRSALDIAAKKATAARTRAINFGSIFLEKMTARRQFMLCAQILKHIDADTPIRFLIAECEAPATVMGAVYLARLYGVDEKLDISPLFETPPAIESGGRFIERLLKEQEFRDYAERRGRISIQIGFSDSGRFMGQCAAALAIERLQVLFARAMSDAKLPGVEALVFNTHGESMGRGAHPGTFTERLNHLTTPWVRSRFSKGNIPFNTECSFQGGEGYLHFQTPQLSTETLDMLWTHSIAPSAPDLNDRFYADINYSWDFYRSLKSWQEALFDRDDYRCVLSAFPRNFLFKTGSRQSKRQQSQSQRADLSAIRAIPHNAILQQLSIPANVSGGIGIAAGRELDRFVDHVRGSPRMQELISLASYARGLTDIAILRAYAGFYAPSYWSTLAVAAAPEKADSYDAVQQALGRGDVSIAFQRLADYFSRDLRLFDTMSPVNTGGATASQGAGIDRLCVLHAIRQAVVAHAISLVAGVPAFSRRHDVDHEELIGLAIDLQLQQTIDLLGDIFPKRSEISDSFAGLEEKVDDGNVEGGAYPGIHANIITPLEVINSQLREISMAISNHYGAFG